MLKAYVQELFTRGLRDYDRSTNVTGVLSACLPIVGLGIVGYAAGWIFGSEIAASEFFGALGITKSNARELGAAIGVAITFVVRAPYRAWLFQYGRAEKLDARLKPKFEVGFEPNPDGVFRTKATYIPSGIVVPEIFVRGYLQSKTDGRLERCTASITKISILRNDQWVMLTDASFPLWWASKHELGVEEIVPGGGKRYFNIARFRHGENCVHLASTVASPGVLEHLTQNQHYRFIVSVDAEGAVGSHLEVEVDWKTDLDVTVKRVNE